MTDVTARLSEYAKLTEEALAKYLDCDLPLQKSVIDAMKYSISAGGKRIRPALTLEFCRLFGGDMDAALPFACAIEMIHTYSLIHDDLPCMDNDDMRRGKPSCHKAFGEDIALLAGDGLLTLAFDTLLSAKLPPERIIAAGRELACAAGVSGMIGGQVIDLESEGKEITSDTLREMYALKTGELLRAAARLGVISAGGSEEALRAADKYSGAVGLAFQITDDILDVKGDPSLLGKNTGSDAANGKSTYVSIYGLEKAESRVNELVLEAVSAVSQIPDSEFLCDLAKYLAGREY